MRLVGSQNHRPMPGRLDNLYIERYDNGFEVSVDITNSGDETRDFALVLAVKCPTDSAFRPCGESVIRADPGKLTTATFELLDTEIEPGKLVSGNYDFGVGFSADDPEALTQPWALDGEDFTPI